MDQATLNIIKAIFLSDNPIALLRQLSIEDLKVVLMFFAEYIPDANGEKLDIDHLDKKHLELKAYEIIERAQMSFSEPSHHSNISSYSRSFNYKESGEKDGHSISFAQRETKEEDVAVLPSDRTEHMPLHKFIPYLGRQVADIPREKIIDTIESIYAKNEVTKLASGDEVVARDLVGFFRASEHLVEADESSRFSSYTRKSGNMGWYCSPDFREVVMKELGAIPILPESKKNWLTATKIADSLTDNNRLRAKIIPKIKELLGQLIESGKKKLILKIDDKEKIVNLSDVLAYYRTSYGTTIYASPYLLGFVEESLEIPKPLPKEGEWLSATKCCARLRLVNSPENIAKVKAKIKQIAIEDRYESQTNPIAGYYTYARSTGYFIREDAIGVRITKDDIIPPKPVIEKVDPFAGMDRKDFITPNDICMELGIETKMINLFAIRKLLSALKNTEKSIEGIDPENDIVIVDSSQRGKGLEHDLCYLKKEKTDLLNSALIRDCVLDIRLWELELLDAIKLRRSNSNLSKVA